MSNVYTEVPRILARQETEQLLHRVRGMARGGGRAIVVISSEWNGELRWARNRVSLASDRRDVKVAVYRYINGVPGHASTNQLDEVSLEAVVRAAERTVLMAPSRENVGLSADPPVFSIPTTTIWSDATYHVTAEQRGALARTLTDATEQGPLLSAGYVAMHAGEIARLGSAGWPYEDWVDHEVYYSQFTTSQCSTTVRHSKGIGSGWAGASSFDWSAIDSATLAKRALEKCRASLSPVAIEPGRYTVILEPQAVVGLVRVLEESLGDREKQEGGRELFSLGPDPAIGLWRTKLGLKIIDERISISHDPMDPHLGILSEPALAPVTWVEHGILQTLGYKRRYAVEKLQEPNPVRARLSFRMSGGSTSIDEMIQTTKRGLLVTRFSNVLSLDESSLLLTGLTRDGLWLVEDGNISKAVKNMRFTESPLFVLNQVEQLGTPVPVFVPNSVPTPYIVPPIKARDFSFTSMIDAV